MYVGRGTAGDQGSRDSFEVQRLAAGVTGQSQDEGRCFGSDIALKGHIIVGLWDDHVYANSDITGENATERQIPPT